MISITLWTMSYRNNEENAITENGELSKSMETDWTQIQTPTTNGML